MSLYNDHPLQSPDSIRLLTLQPGSNDAAIEVSVTIVRLSTQPDFTAFSYTWGNPVDEQHPAHRDYDNGKHHYIACAGESLDVYENLYEALWQLREKKEYSRLWIDAICIDQNNVEEKNHQLSLMPRIYCEASRTIIWLGKDDMTTREAVQCLNSLQHKESFMNQVLSRYEAGTSFLDTLTNGEKQALELLLGRRWFDRVWTLQEVLLPQHTRCLCGPYELDIESACVFAALLLRSNLSRLVTSDSPSISQPPICQLSNAACIAAWHGSTRPPGGFGSRALLRYPKIDHKMEIPRVTKWLVALELLVHEARQRNCCKLEDKILAPLAFALYETFAPKTPSFAPLETEARDLIDCRIPVIELYIKFTHFLIDSMENLDILSRAHRDVPRNDAAEELDLPSWVPPFHEAGTKSLLDDLLFTQYNAAAFLGPYRKAKSRTNTLELPVQAVFFGRIIQISTHAAPADNTAAWLSHVCNSTRYKQEVELGDNSDLAHAVIREIGDQMASWHQWEMQRRKRQANFLRSNLSAVAAIQLNTPVSPTTMRRLFRFDVHGQRQIGLAPVQAQESDHLCILQGARVPFIVRDAGSGKYTLIGEAFAENRMHGQVRALNFIDQKITLV